MRETLAIGVEPQQNLVSTEAGISFLRSMCTDVIIAYQSHCHMMAEINLDDMASTQETTVSFEAVSSGQERGSTAGPAVVDGHGNASSSISPWYASNTSSETALHTGRVLKHLPNCAVRARDVGYKVSHATAISNCRASH